MGISFLFGEGNGTPLQYSCLENPMDGGAWKAAVHGVVKNRTRLSDFTFTFRFHALEKEMATHSSVLAWRIPGTGEPSGLPSMGSHTVGHDWSDLAIALLLLLKSYIHMTTNKHLYGTQCFPQRSLLLLVCCVSSQYKLTYIVLFQGYRVICCINIPRCIQ